MITQMIEELKSERRSSQLGLVTCAHRSLRHSIALVETLSRADKLAYNAQIVEEPHYLRINCSGSYSRARSEQLIALVRREADERRYTRVLVDLQAVGETVPNLDRFHLGEMCAAMLRGLRVAVIDLTEAPDAFVETVAVNRGATMRLN